MATITQQNRLVETREVLALVGCSEATLRHKVHCGEMPAPIMGGGGPGRKKKWRAKDIDAFLDGTWRPAKRR
jgi:predicted DNA-binding transcriptional regulator AlpA